jgi:hypothetical protein
MKRLLLILLIIYAGAVYVKGYRKKDGTYVKGYYRTKANRTVKDNYSFKGNINPYTGEKGRNSYKENKTSLYSKFLDCCFDGIKEV